MVVPGQENQDEKVFYPPEDLREDAHVPDFNSYLALYKKSIEEPEGKPDSMEKHEVAFEPIDQIKQRYVVCLCERVFS